MGPIYRVMVKVGVPEESDERPKNNVIRIVTGGGTGAVKPTAENDEPPQEQQDIDVIYCGPEIQEARSAYHANQWADYENGGRNYRRTTFETIVTTEVELSRYPYHPAEDFVVEDEADDCCDDDARGE